VLNALRQHLQTSASETACLGADESRLLEEINRGPTEDEWRRYHELVERRRTEQLTGGEHNELVAISDRVEQFNTRRIECLIELARLRGTTLPKLMDDLGIPPPPVI
jgi:hypothetical protein